MWVFFSWITTPLFMSLITSIIHSESCWWLLRNKRGKPSSQVPPSVKMVEKYKHIEYNKENLLVCLFNFTFFVFRTLQFSIILTNRVNRLNIINSIGYAQRFRSDTVFYDMLRERCRRKLRCTGGRYQQISCYQVRNKSSRDSLFTSIEQNE